VTTVVARCPVPHEIDKNGDVVPLESCPLCGGRGEIIVEVVIVDDELAIKRVQPVTDDADFEGPQ
jgi:hypothetical protein